MTIRLRESENKAEFGERFFDSEELQVIGIDGGKIFGSIFQFEGKNRDFGALDTFGEIDARTFHFHARFLSLYDSGRILQPVKNTVVNLLRDVVDGNRSAGILETMAAMIASGGRKQGPVGSQDVEAQKPQLLDNRNVSMKDLLVQGFSNTNTEVGKSSLAGDAITPKPCPMPIVLTARGVSKNQAEVLDGSDPFEITEQI